MATGMPFSLSTQPTKSDALKPSGRSILVALVLSLVFVFATRWPVARIEPFESDEFGFLASRRTHWFPMHHTLFMTFGRAGAVKRRSLPWLHRCSTCFRAPGRS